jgi:hypothetical protein
MKKRLYSVFLVGCGDAIGELRENINIIRPL